MAAPKTNMAGVRLFYKLQDFSVFLSLTIYSLSSFFAPRGTMNDGLFFLLCGEAALPGINKRIKKAEKNERFVYRPNLTNNTLTSAGETPGMREACPMVAGRMRVSFWRASMVSACIA